MKNVARRQTAIGVFMLLALAIITGSCSSRYRLDLYITDGTGRHKIKTENATFTSGTVLNNPYADTRIILGEGNTIVVPAGMRGSGLYKGKANVLSFDEYLRLRIYVQLPSTIAPGSSDLVNNAYVLILERYDKPIEEKVFLPQSGQVTIDSVASGRLFMSLKGEFANSADDSLAFDGKFKLKLTD